MMKKEDGLKMVLQYRVTVASVCRVLAAAMTTHT